MLAHEYVRGRIELRGRRQNGKGAHYEYAPDEPGREDLYGLNHAYHQGLLIAVSTHSSKDVKTAHHRMIFVLQIVAVEHVPPAKLSKTKHH